MRKIITTTMLTLDGVMQAPSGSKEDASEGFEYGGWQTEWNEEADKITDKIQAEPFDLLFGRKTYNIFAGYWPQHEDEPHWGKPYSQAKKYVVSHKPINLAWDNSELITGDVIEEIKKLKNTEGRDLWIWGSSNLIQTLLKHNLVDRMYLWIFPVVIGNGKKLFGDGTIPGHLKLVDGKILSTGVMFAAYEFTSPLKKSTL